MGNKQSRSDLSPKSVQELRDQVDFTVEEINDWYHEYKKSLAKGERELTQKQFRGVYNSLFAGDATEFAEHVFRTFDKDNSGSVNFEEFLIGLCVSGGTDSDAQLKWAFNMYDIDGDGFISREEMRKIVAAIYKMTQAITPDELNTPDKMTDKLFKEYDQNNDGMISWKEFYDGAKRDPVIVHLLQCDPDPGK